MAMKTLLHPLLRRFMREERGAILLETIIMLPILIWALFAMAAYWDIYRTINRQQKAAYAMADVITRQTNVTPAYVDAMDDVMNYMLDDGQLAKVRITSVGWSSVNNRFEVKWSRSPGGALPALTTSTLQPLAPKIPAMTASSTVVLFESELAYKPNIKVPLVDSVGVTAQTLKQFIVTRPRFGGGKVCLTTVTPC
jgi:Flp pilus assembly protein TadG